MRKIPKTAKLVYKGILFDVYHWRQRLLNNTYKTYEAVKRRDAVSIIPTVGDKIIVANEERIHHPRIIGLFGGFVERGESSNKAAKRELTEESGYVSSDWKLLYVNDSYHREIDFKTYLFLARDCKKVGDQRPDDGERIEVKYVDFDQLLDLAMSSKGFDRAIGNYIAKINENDQERKRFKRLLFPSLDWM